MSASWCRTCRRRSRKWQAAGVPIEMGKTDKGPRPIRPGSPRRTACGSRSWRTRPRPFRSGIITCISTWRRRRSRRSRPGTSSTSARSPACAGQFQAADIPGANLTFTKSDTPTIADQGPRARPHRLRREGHGRYREAARADAGIKLDQPVLTPPRRQRVDASSTIRGEPRSSSTSAPIRCRAGALAKSCGCVLPSWNGVPGTPFVLPTHIFGERP